MSALDQKQTFAAQQGMSALPPKSGHRKAQLECPLCANSGHGSAIARTLVGASNATAQKLPKRTSRRAPPQTKPVARCRVDSSRC